MNADDTSKKRGLLALHETRAERAPAKKKEHKSTVDETTKDLALPPYTLQPDVALAERFVDHGEIARGGMGAVHKVLERSLNRHVAMKVLPRDKAADARARNRFIAEAQITGQLEHPNVVPVYELGVDDAGTTYFTMKLVDGVTLSAFLAEHDAAQDDDALFAALDVFAKVCDALSFAHSRGVIHRDIKPSNIMTGEFGQVYLMDWGIALVAESGASTKAPKRDDETRRRTTSLTAFAVEGPGTVLGTYAYMSPEQAKGDAARMDERTDVFGLGAVLFRVVAGRPPFVGQNELDTLALAAECALPAIEARPGDRLRATLLQVATRAMRKERDDRYPNVLEMKRAVEGVVRGRLRFPITKVPAGTLVIQEGSRGDDAYIVRKGSCRVFRVVDGQRHLLQEIGPGGVFGETAVFTGLPRNAHVEAATDVEMWVVPGKVLQEELGLDGWLGAFVRSVGARFTERSARVTELEGALRRERVVRAALVAIARRGKATLGEVAAAGGADPARAAEALRDAGVFLLGGDAPDATVELRP